MSVPHEGYSRMKRVVRTKFDIYVLLDILSRPFSLLSPKSLDFFKK